MLLYTALKQVLDIDTSVVQASTLSTCNHYMIFMFYTHRMSSGIDHCTVSYKSRGIHPTTFVELLMSQKIACQLKLSWTYNFAL